MPDLKPVWKTAQISQIADHCLGKMLDKQKNKGDLKPYLRNLNVRWFDFDLSDVLQMRFEKDEADRYQAQKGDLIVCEGGYPGRAAIWESDEPIYLQKALHRVRVHDSVLAKWVLYWLCLKDLDGTLADSFSGTGIQHFTKAALARFSVPLPPLEEQKRIVAVLDQAFAALDRARAHAEANLADAEALFVRLAYDNLRRVAETGKFAPVGEIADHCLGKMLDRNKNKGTFRPYLRNINVRWFEVDTSDVLEMRIEDRELDRYEVRKGDLLICEGGYPGRASIYGGDTPTYFQKALHRVRFSDESLAKVLMYWLFVEDKLGKLKGCFSGTGISHFTGKTLASYLMPMSDPPTNARAVESIDRHLARTNSVISGYRQKLTDLATLRQSLLQKAFSGELT